MGIGWASGFANLDEGKSREKLSRGNFFLSLNHRFRQSFWDTFFNLDLPTAVDELGLHQIANVPIGKIGIQNPSSSVGIDHS